MTFDFDLSDVEADAERVRRLDAHIVRSRELIARAFAQGFVAALEDGNAAEWLEYYEERAE